MPLAGNRLETLRACLGDFLRLACLAGINAGRKLLSAHHRVFRAPFSKSRRDRPRRKAAFPCRRSGISNANTCRRWADLQIKPAAIEQLVSFVLWFRRTNLDVSQAASGGISLSRSTSCPQRCPHNGGSCSWTASDHAGHYILENYCIYKCFMDVTGMGRKGKWWRRGESNPRPKVFRQI